MISAFSNIIVLLVCITLTVVYAFIYNGTTLNYILLVVYKWKLSTDLWITIWTDKNTM